MLHRSYGGEGIILQIINERIVFFAFLLFK
jgi:hypothetical protein